MTEIRILQHSLEPAEQARAYRVLRECFMAGLDLGSRRQHIKSIGETLEIAHHDLRLMVERMRKLPPPPGTDLGTLADKIDKWSRALASCTATIVHEASPDR